MSESKYANFDYDLSQKILTLLKGGYPARLKRVLVVTAPLWFKAPFKILRLFVKEKLRDRVYTVSVSELITYIPKLTLPVRLGGTQTPCHKRWLDFCQACALNQTPDPCVYFISRLRPHSSPISQSPSLELDNKSVSDLDSDGSKDTVPEKHTNEEPEKELEEETDSDMDDPNKQHCSKDTDDRKQSSTRKRKTPDINKTESPSNRKESNKDLLTDEPIKKRPPSSGSNILEDSIHMPNTSGLTVVELLAKVNKMKRKGLMGEYGSIKMEAPSGTFNHSKLKHNTSKNRYTDVLCLDHSRVCLSSDTENTEDSDYINANYVDGYMQKNAFISTQGPLAKTYTDFWRMVWQNQTRVIVMTTKCMERSRVKCGQYWPLDLESDEQFDEFIVYNKKVSLNDKFVETKLMLLNTKTSESRQITHLQFTSWPDYGVPPAEPFLDFLFRVRDVQTLATKEMGRQWQGHPLGPPIIVHCSAGIGRTGTFITVDICLRRLEHIGNVNVRETVRGIRSQRAFSIQMPDQYIFCHTAIIEQAMRRGLIDKMENVRIDDSDSE